MSRATGEVIPAGEAIGRFIYDSDKIKASRVYANAFMPPPVAEGERIETSVCQLALCNIDRIWSLGRTIIKEKSLKGFGELSVCVIHEVGLNCIATPEPGYEEHAVIIGWPADKVGQKEMAFKLAIRAQPHLPPTN